ncbi:hypothetical protein IJM86_00755 [bacterium]|nr:hypothetical protein [bacterium]
MINVSQEQLEELETECFKLTIQKFFEIYNKEDITPEEKKNSIKKELKKNNQFIENLVFTQLKQANKNREIARSQEDIMKNFTRIESPKQKISKDENEVFSLFNASTDKRIIVETLIKNNIIRKKLQKARIQYLYNLQDEGKKTNK